MAPMNYAVLLLLITAVVIFFAVTGGFPWLFVGLLQGGMGIITFVLRESAGLAIPDGLTLPAVAAMAALGTGVMLARSPTRHRLLLSPLSAMMLLFSLLVVAGTLYSWHSMATDKALKYIAANYVSFVVMLFLSSWQRQKLYMLLIIVSVMVALGVVFSFAFGGTGAARGRYSTLGIDTITAARTIGLGLILVLYLPRCRQLRGALAVFLGAGVLLAASRGPVIALFLAVLLQPLLCGGPLISLKLPRRMMWLLGSAALGLAILVVVVMFYSPIILAENWGPLRLLRETTLLDRNIVSRFSHWATAFQDAQLSPWVGWGTAGYAGSAPWRDPVVLSYPHNIFLEILSEWGGLGLGLFTLILGRGIVSIRRLSLWSRELTGSCWVEEARLVTALMVYSLVNACVSGEIYNNRTLWLALGAIEVLRYEISRCRTAQYHRQPELSEVGAVL